MTKFNRNNLGIIIIMIMSIIIMFVIDYFIQPGYLWKSILKILVFLIIPLLYIVLAKGMTIKDQFKIASKDQIVRSLGLGVLIYILIIGGYFMLRAFIDLDNIQKILGDSLNVKKDNFIFVALYISFFNSLLEEFFFRGFLFLGLYGRASRPMAYGISALAFAVYHVAIMIDWFSVGLFFLALAGLFIGGLIFNWLNEKNKNIYNSWLVHMFANFAINTVGFIMFGIL